MRQLLPPDASTAVDPFAAYAADRRPMPADRPWLLSNMVVSADGATAVDGLSGALGGDGDRQVFRAIRALADVIVVGAATARAENYGPPVVSDAVRAQRTARGQQPAPAIAVVSGSANLDPTARLFADGYRPVIYTAASAPADRVGALDPVADVVTAGDARVDLAAVLRDLGSRGHRVALCEGGPSINGQLLGLDLFDELAISIAPVAVSGDAKRLMVGPVQIPPRDFVLERVLEHDHVLFCRYVRNR